MRTKLQLLSQNTYFKVMLLISILVLTFFLRAIHSDRVPGYGHLEEHLFGWSGMYLIEEGVPVSWSTLDYPKDHVIYSGPVGSKDTFAVTYVDLIKPWLDEPPLFSLIIGGSATLFGADRHFIIPSSYMRFPMLFFGLLTSITLFLLTKKLFGYWIAIGAVFIWGTVPLFVFSSRLAVPENAIAWFYLLCLYLFLLYKDKPRVIFLLLLCTIPGIAGLMKPTGYFIAPLIAFLFFQQKQWKKGAFILIALVPFILAFLWYGLHFDPQSFWHILAIQGGRPAGWNGLTYLLSNPGYDIFPFFDAWYVFSWIAAFYLIIKNHDHAGIKFISWALLYWLLIVLVSGGEQDMLPWYRYPLFPLLSIYLTLGIQTLLAQSNFFSLVIASAFLPGNRIHLVNAFFENTPSTLFRLEFAATLIPGLLRDLWPTNFFKRLTTLTIVVLILAGVILNILVIWNYYARICEAKVCPIGPSTFLTR
jgi:4-amino-4-deoxy-L-arabinose transferase-like glycosyltransferase